MESDNAADYEVWTFDDWVRGWFDNPGDWEWMEDEQPRTYHRHRLSPMQRNSSRQ